MNANQLPQIGSIWQAVTEVVDEQNYQSLCEAMKEEIQGIQLPTTGEALKSKLNDVHNNYYNRLSALFEEGDIFKKYNSEFSKLTSRLKKELTSSHQAMMKKTIMEEVKSFVRENLTIDNVEPTSLSSVRVIVDRLQLRTKKDPDAYEYVIGVLFDMMKVS